MVNFSDWLAKELESRSMSPSDLARAAHKAPAVISRILNGDRNPAPDTIKDIALALKLPVDVVFRVAVGLPQSNDNLSPKKRQLIHLAEESDDDAVDMALAVLETAWERKKRK